MKIWMTGLNHKQAGLDVREKFAVTKENMKRILTEVTRTEGIGGCVILATCNRTEVYVSVADHIDFNLTQELCKLFAQEYHTYDRYFTERQEENAIRHLCEVAAGMDSQILGDDQIITQVREAVELSRSWGCTNSYIETMFRIAIKAAKRIKTEIVIRDPKSSSAPYRALETLKQHDMVAGRHIVVIGNGQMGRLTSALLIREKAKVTVTLREYKKGAVLIPKGADTIPYSHRYEAIETADAVISVTTSPHYTVHDQDITKLKARPKIIIDLAVPRDVEPSIKELEGIKLFTIDDLADDEHMISAEKAEKAERIIREDMERYDKWCLYKSAKRGLG